MAGMNIKLKVENLVAYGLGEALNGTHAVFVCNGGAVIGFVKMKKHCYEKRIRDGILRLKPFHEGLECLALLFAPKEVVFKSKGVEVFRCPASLVLRENPQIDVRKDLDNYDDFARQITAAMKGGAEHEKEKSEIQKISGFPAISLCLGGVFQGPNTTLPDRLSAPRKGD